MDRAKLISNWIQRRKNDGEEPMPCLFQITTPNFLGGTMLKEDQNVKAVISILDKYGINWQTVDTIAGAFNLNRDWIEATDIPCYIEYCGVYPAEWDIEDVVALEQMEYEGKIMIRVLWHTKDGFIPNN